MNVISRSGDARRRGLGLVGALLVACSPAEPSESDVLPSWNAGPARNAIISFVDQVTDPSSPAFVPEAERIAVFDNDGTLWAEQPIYFQLAFAIDRSRELVPTTPTLAENALLRALASADTGALGSVTTHDVLDLMAATHSGMSLEDFDSIVSRWVATGRHPRFDRPYTDLRYQPMLELLDYLRAHGFKTFIVSGGGVDFMRVFAEDVYGVPPEQVVGSMGKTTFELRDGEGVLVKQPGVDFIDDGPGKPVGIARFIGRRPILAFGNSDGDLAMLQYTAGGEGAHLIGIVHHDDADREWAYDRASKIGHLDSALDEAQARRWTVVSMRDDWAKVYSAPDLP